MGRTTTARRTLGAAVLLALVIAACTPTPNPGGPPKPPGQATSGFGSSAGYIATSVQKSETGSGTSGSRVWWYVPNQLKQGTTAPVVVFLHGFALLAPEIYQGHIDHLWRQGYIVVYPQFNAGGLGIITDTNQNTMLSRARSAVATALDRIDTLADRSNVVVYGHSLGGLMASCWNATGGTPARAIVLANPSANGGTPSFVQGLITPLPYQTCAPQNQAPAVVLTGSSDTIAAPSEALTLYGLLGGSASRVLYLASSDSYGDPDLVADHMAPIQDDGALPGWMADAFLGGEGVTDTLDFRFYYAALDAVLAGQGTVPFALGAWSDGRAVTPVAQLAP